jgi:hypothetical protein
MRLAILILILSLIFSNCKKQKSIPEQKAAILSIKEMQQLASVEYQVSKVVKATDKAWFKLGDRKILIRCKAKVKAGIDLAGLTEKQIVIENEQITLYLPHAKILALQILEEDIDTPIESTGFFRDRFSLAEKQQLLTQAEQDIREKCSTLGIEKDAEKFAQQYLENLLKQIGYNKVNINFKEPPANNLN